MAWPESRSPAPMRASALIQRLQALIAEHGDREIAVYDETGATELPMGEIQALEESPEREAAFLIVVRPE
jgi:hypothetical protein